MAIAAKDVMALRQRTGMGMMECKRALTEAEGDMDQAVEVLRSRAKGKMDERTERAAGEGTLAIAHQDGAAALVEINSETDFTARNESFIEAAQKIAHLALDHPDGEVQVNEQITEAIDSVRLTTRENVSFRRGYKFSGGASGSYLHHNRQVGAIVQAQGEADPELLKGICQHIAAHTPTPLAIDQSTLPDDLVEEQRQAAVSEAEASGKPPEIAEKIASGKLRKWVDEHTLLGQQYVRDLEGKQQVRDALPEGVTLQRFVRYRVGAEGGAEATE